MAERITNNDLYEKLGKIEEIALATRDQAMKTNGRVSKLERWQAGIIAVNEDRRSDIPKDNSSVDYTKIVLTALGLIGTALGIIAILVGR